MFIGLPELKLRSVRFELDVPAGEIDYDGKLVQASVLHTEGTALLLSHSLAEIRIQGCLSVTIDASCDRCLEPAALAIEKKYDLIYLPAEETKSGGEEEIEEDGIEVGFYEGAGLQLNDVLREVVLLALPMQLICSEACKGICPFCGQNRNQQDCGCSSKPMDDRWSKLKALRAESGSPN